MYNGQFRLFHLEDDSNDAFFLASALKRTHRPCKLTRFRDGTEAVAFLEHIRAVEMEAPHLIISDLKMPQMDGLEFIRWLRQSRFSCIPTIVLSGSSLAQDVLEAYRSGANSFSVKPVNALQLDELISTVLKYWHEASLTPAHVVHGPVTSLCTMPDREWATRRLEPTAEYAKKGRA